MTIREFVLIYCTGTSLAFLFIRFAEKKMRSWYPRTRVPVFGIKHLYVSLAFAVLAGATAVLSS